MNIVDLLDMIIVVAVLLTIALGATGYLVHRVRVARRPGEGESAPSGSPWFFVRYSPEKRSPDD